MKVLITGIAGFIGFHVARRLLEQGHDVFGIDNLSEPLCMKISRLSELGFNDASYENGQLKRSAKYANLHFEKIDIQDNANISSLFESEKFDKVIHLAAKTGVRCSIDSHSDYIDSNIVGFSCILANCITHNVSHLIYASSSSVYGNNAKVPFSEEDKVDNPVSLYAATKKADELMASCCSNLYGLHATGLRFFTVYGPWGRPDMAPMLFAKAIVNGEPVKVFNGGDLLRDFTYVDDIVEGVCLVANKQPQSSGNRHSIYNIGCSNPIKLTDFISILEDALGQKAERQMLPMQPGDVYQTYADTTALERDFGYRPQTNLQEGIHRFVEWFSEYKDKLGWCK